MNDKKIILQSCSLFLCGQKTLHIGNAISFKFIEVFDHPEPECGCYFLMLKPSLLMQISTACFQKELRTDAYFGHDKNECLSAPLIFDFFIILIFLLVFLSDQRHADRLLQVGGAAGVLLELEAPSTAAPAVPGNDDICADAAVVYASEEGMCISKESFTVDVLLCSSHHFTVYFRRSVHCKHLLAVFIL